MSSGYRIKVYRLVRPIESPRANESDSSDSQAIELNLSAYLLRQNDSLDLRYFPFVPVSKEMDGPFFDFVYRAIYDDGVNPKHYLFAEINLEYDNKVYDLSQPDVQTEFRIVPGSTASLKAKEYKLVFIDRKIKNDEIVKLHRISKEFPGIQSFSKFKEIQQKTRRHGTVSVFSLLHDNKQVETKAGDTFAALEARMHDTGSKKRRPSCSKCSRSIFIPSQHSTGTIAFTKYHICYFYASILIYEQNIDPDKLQIVKLKVILDENVCYSQCPHESNSEMAEAINSSSSGLHEILVTRPIEPYEVIKYYKIPTGLPRSSESYRNYARLLRGCC